MHGFPSVSSCVPGWFIANNTFTCGLALSIRFDNSFLFISPSFSAVEGAEIEEGGHMTRRFCCVKSRRRKQDFVHTVCFFIRFSSYRSSNGRS